MLQKIANAEKNLQTVANSAKNFQKVARWQDGRFYMFIYELTTGRRENNLVDRFVSL